MQATLLALSAQWLINGTTHYCSGQEADSVGDSSNLKEGAHITVTRRFHGDDLARTVPEVVDSGPGNAVQLGVKFRSDVAGTIRGIRFYKASTNTGTHVGSLWSSTGTRLANATFTNETASGWQQVNFLPPVAISANTVYVASYHTTTSHYSINTNYFASTGTDNAPLHALANGVSGGNGVYRYGASNVFPNQTWKTSNYWVDVVFRPN